MHDPTYVYLKAAHHDPNVSWLDIPESQGGGAPDDDPGDPDKGGTGGVA